MDSIDRVIKLIFNKNTKDFGDNGGVFVDVSATGNFGPIQVVEDCVFGTGHKSNILGLNDGATTYKAGTIVYGIHTVLDIDSGSVIAYYRK